MGEPAPKRLNCLLQRYSDILYALVRKALCAERKVVQVQSLPIRMAPENLAIFRDNQNYEFWLDLKQASDRFEILRQVPEVSFYDGRYRYGRTVDGQIATDPLGACPEFAALHEIVVRNMASDHVESKLMISEISNPAIGHNDGGMHPLYRYTLRRINGRTLLAQKTFRKMVPVSLPDAALADPFIPD